MFNVFNPNTNRTISFLLTYRKNNSNITQYVDNLNNILQRNTIDIILGDFNINNFNQVPISPLKILIQNINKNRSSKKLKKEHWTSCYTLWITPRLDLFDIVSDQYKGKEPCIDTKYWNISIVLLQFCYT